MVMHAIYLIWNLMYTGPTFNCVLFERIIIVHVICLTYLLLLLYHDRNDIHRFSDVDTRSQLEAERVRMPIR
jgi:hypothetical protein